MSNHVTEDSSAAAARPRLLEVVRDAIRQRVSYPNACGMR